MSEPTEPEPSFEASTSRLADVVEELERGDLPLERALALFEEGVKLARAAQTRLDRAERQVEELLGIDARGQPITRAVAGYPAPRRDGGSAPDEGAGDDEP
jgi:exodeoxyribonuclease VII small subunit